MVYLFPSSANYWRGVKNNLLRVDDVKGATGILRIFDQVLRRLLILNGQEIIFIVAQINNLQIPGTAVAPLTSSARTKLSITLRALYSFEKDTTIITIKGVR